jgi:glycine dehydrogenase subunit 1
MEFIPHTPDDDREMLETVGVETLSALFDAVPEDLRLRAPLDVPPELSEPELLDHIRSLAEDSPAARLTCFAGGGAYEHFVPAVARALASRGEFATSYTPYQPELSQGVLQAVFEFQTLVCELYGMEVANASLYDGASALVEGVNLAVRTTGRERVLISDCVHPHYLQVLDTYTSGLGLKLERVPRQDEGATAWDEARATEAACVVTQHPNFFGLLEDVGRASELAHDEGALSVVVADPTAMGILRPPGELGADVVVGEGAAFGNPMMYGGPYVGFFATRLEHVRQVPGRIAGETSDADGRRAYVLTLQAREQHIRRARATSNVCTNQTLMAIAASIHLSWLGPEGIRRMGEICLRRAEFTARRLRELPGCRLRFESPRFKEFVLETPIPGTELVRTLAERGFLVGPALGRWYPDLKNCVLVAVTERRAEEDIRQLSEAIEKELAER